MEAFRNKIEGVLDSIDLVRPESPDVKPTPSAVIVPTVVNDESPADSEILFTLRTQKVKTHKGQVSFPGGVYETKDSNLLQTALRETEEETGIDPQALTLAGMLNPYNTLTGYRIYPYLGFLDRRPELKISKIEIEKTFYVPLRYILDPSRISEHDIHWEGMTLRVKAIEWDKMIIWGATFNILVDLIRRVDDMMGGI